MIRRVRDRQTFDRLRRHGTRIRRSDLWCTWCPEPQLTTTSIAFAIGRPFGSAVARNRMRRRLRAVLGEIDRQRPLPPGVMLIGAHRSAIELTFDELWAQVTALIDQARATTGPAGSGR